MKWFKLLVWLIVIGFLAALVYQNLEYFNSKTVLNLDLKIKESWQWKIPAFQTGFYMLICFAAGLLLTGTKAMGIKFRLNKEIKKQAEMIDQLKEQINELKTELDVFTHDPYIKNALTAASDETSPEAKTEPLPQPAPDPVKTDDQTSDSDEQTKEAT